MRRVVSFPARLCLPILLLATSAWALAADDPAFDQALATGEFGPALATARGAADRDARDARFQKLASAQAKAGAVDAGLATAAEIRSDLDRAEALRSISSEAPRALGAPGGGANADFNSLMNLIRSTVAPDSWDDKGGKGDMQPFPTGVYADAEGVLRKAMRSAAGGTLEQLKSSSSRAESGANANVRKTARLRSVSLPRLERAVQLRLASGLPLDDEMLVLAGLEKIEYLFVYPETGDLVLAGPAGDWQFDLQGRPIASQSKRPVLRLDDLVTVWRHTLADNDPLGCAITPTQEALKSAKEYLESTKGRPLAKGGSTKWLEEVRRRIGLQKVDVWGIDPTTSTARVIVEADYHMKLIGIGLEPGVVGMESYLDTIPVGKGQAPPALDVLRWWFTMKYDEVVASSRRDAFEIRGQSVQVQSENEWLTEQGQRVHTNKSEPLNQEFAQSFTRNFAKLCEKYPIYAELKNVFDLTLIAALVEREQLADQVDWHATCFGPGGELVVTPGNAPQWVETVANKRMVAGRQVLAAVSGGVRADASSFVTVERIKVDSTGELSSEQAQKSPPSSLDRDNWWWD